MSDPAADSDVAARMRRVESSLVMEPALRSQPALKLSPLSETRFHAESLGIEMTFQKNEAGETTGLIFRQNAADMPARRLSATSAQP